jgi:hypothetical protein
VSQIGNILSRKKVYGFCLSRLNSLDSSMYSSGKKVSKIQGLKRGARDPA